MLDSDGTVIFTSEKLSLGFALTRKLSKHHGFPWLHIDLINLGAVEASEIIWFWIDNNKIKIMSVADSRASKPPEIYQLTKAILTAALTK